MNIHFSKVEYSLFFSFKNNKYKGKNNVYIVLKIINIQVKSKNNEYLLL